MLSGKKLLLLGFIVVLLVIIPLTVYLVQQQQKLGVGAAPSTVLSFVPSSKTVTVNEEFTLDVNMAPGGNEVSFIKLTINFDPAKLQPNPLGSKCSINSSYVICPNPSLFPGTPLQAPTTTNNSISVTLSVGSNPTNAIKSSSIIATVGFKAKETSATPAVISFAAAPATQVLSIANADQFNENVLADRQSANITITQAAGASPAASASSSNQAPVCTGSSVDKATSGNAPYAINLQASGTDSNGTINKVTFNWGDTQTEVIATGSGILTNSANVTKNHTYQNGGNFTATVIFTDNQGLDSAVGTCTKTFSITGPTASPTPTAAPAGSTGTGSSGGTTTTQIVTVVSPTPSPTPTVEPTPTPTPASIAQDTTKGGLEAPGPGDGILSVGAIGVITAILGLLILLAL